MLGGALSSWPREKTHGRLFGPDLETLWKSHSGLPRTGKSQTECSLRETATKPHGVGDAAPELGSRLLGEERTEGPSDS